MKSNKTSAFLIAAPKSNSGKTMISLALMKTLVNRGITVQPFKCGPDYIDPMYHTKIAGRTSYNLDSWMASEEHVRSVFEKNIPASGVAVVEGVMGLFDGAQKDKGSSANIARLLNIPVILVVDAASMAYSAAPLLFGFKNFDKNIALAGVIFNKVSGESHYRFLKEAAEDAGVEPLGYLPRDERLSVKSRHLGLHLPNENNQELFTTAAELVAKHIDIDRLLELTAKTEKTAPANPPTQDKKIAIALAHDEAFNFSYAANIDAMEQLGTVTRFSPVHDKTIPAADLLWLPGGYPELFARQLAENTTMQQSINEFIEQGKMVIAECGGMMYLGKEIIDENGKREAMCRVFNISTSFENKKLHLGYRQINRDDFELKGHEFHYSNLIQHEPSSINIEVKNARGIPVEMPVLISKNCWASYMHIYLGEEGKLEQFLAKNFGEDWQRNRH
ncbi:cobyrinate a,c-diamide synthase [Draconibacterium orientale]|uniref:cobyrinate a,c-diamide synthase n=1 Tax=Draconibacterium orientale TaxID=1168034 RepID=UPI002ABDBE78|nr:cobyrinate a,c-diamide synthase [Draconibacterium orientale]